MVEPRVPKRRRPDPEPTAGSASSGTEPARHSAETLGGGIHLGGDTRRSHSAETLGGAVSMAKDYILVGEIRSACHDRHADPTKTIKKIGDMLAARALSEDEAQEPGPRMMFPAEECETCDQQ